MPQFARASGAYQTMMFLFMFATEVLPGNFDPVNSSIRPAAI